MAPVLNAPDVISAHYALLDPEDVRGRMQRVRSASPTTRPGGHQEDLEN